MQRERVIEIYAVSDRTRIGSGYLLDDGLVLTARHVIGANPTSLEVRPLGTQEWQPATVAWPGSKELDVALLRTQLPEPSRATLRWGELGGSEPVACTAVGFPWAQAKRDACVELRDTEQLFGQVAPLTGDKAGTYAITVTSSAPRPRTSGSPWQGMSGAALFAGPYLVGIVIVDPDRYGTDRLVAVPAAQLLVQDQVRQLVADAGADASLEHVGSRFRIELTTELSVSIRSPYEPLPADYRVERSPTRLLWAEHGLVPYLGRGAEFAALLRWCMGEAALSIRLLHGRGGSGKSRLAAELCMALRKEGWDAGPVAFNDPVPATRLELERETLLVVDEADTHIGHVAQLIRHLDRHYGTPVRALLLARSAGIWIEDLVRECPAAETYLETPVDLDATPLGAPARGTQFEAAARTFAPILQATVPPTPWVSLVGDDFDVPLMVHANALLATLGERPPSAASAASATDRILGRLVDREQRRWESLRPRHVDLELAIRAVSVATLVAADHEEQHLRLLSAIKELSSETRGTLARWLAYRVDPVRPDLLASAVLARTLPHVPDLPLAVYDYTTTDSERIYILSTLARAAGDQPDLVPLLQDHVLAPRLAELVTHAIDRRDLSFSSALAELVRIDRPGFVHILYEQCLPLSSAALAALALALAQQAIRYLLATVQERPGALRFLAGSFNNLSNRLVAVGRRDDALVAAEEALACFRVLAAAEPGAHERSLATALDTRSNSLAELGQYEGSLVDAAEAVVIRRNLASAEPETSLPDLAVSLHNLSHRLAKIGRKEAALAAVDEALGYFRELAAAQPKPPPLFPQSFSTAPLFAASDAADLGRCESLVATALDTRSSRLSDMGQQEEGLAPVEEAVAIRRRLAAAQPDTYLPDLAASLTNLANRLATLGRPEDALVAVEEAVGLYSGLPQAESAALGPNVAISLTTLAYVLNQLGREHEAVAVRDGAHRLRAQQDTSR